MKYNHFVIKNQNWTFEWLQPELVSEVKRCDGPLNILLCVCALRSVTHSQSKRSANAHAHGKPNPAQITLLYISPVSLYIYCFCSVYNEIIE